MQYDYLKALVSDIEDYLADNNIDICALTDNEYEDLRDQLWDEDSVTGNISGYATEKEAEQWVGQNLRLAFLAMLENGYDKIDLTRQNIATFIDIIIRTYLLDEALEKVKELREKEKEELFKDE